MRARKDFRARLLRKYRVDPGWRSCRGFEGDPVASPHLLSRYEVEDLLGRSRAALTTLRTGLIIGPDSATYRMLRDVVLRLPVLPRTPEMLARLQPIALRDMVRYLVGVRQRPETAGRAFDTGGPDIVTYVDLLREISAALGRRRIILPVPGALNAIATRLVVRLTGVEASTAQTLFESMPYDLICRDTSLRNLLPGDLLSVRQAMAYAVVGTR